MIRIDVYRDGHQRVQRFVVQGHAEFAEHGKDIVCAGVSTVVFGALYSCEQLLGVTLTGEQSPGVVDARIPERNLYDDKADKVQLLIEAMLCSLRMVEEQYGDYVQVHDPIK